MKSCFFKLAKDEAKEKMGPFLDIAFAYAFEKLNINFHDCVHIILGTLNINQIEEHQRLLFMPLAVGHVANANKREIGDASL